MNTLKVTPTPNSQLKSVIQKSLTENGAGVEGGSTKLIELGGNLITK